MSDETTTTEAKPTTFGVGNTEARVEYRKAVNEAEHAYDAQVTEINKPLDKANSALYELLGYGRMVDALVTLLRTQAQPDLDTKLAEARRVRDQAIEEATQRRDENTETDAFFTFVDNYIRNSHGEGYADTLIEHMPFTFDSLKKLADDEDWCADYESVMRRATREGALPDETVEVRYNVDSWDVPSEYNAQPGQTWQRVATFPAYVRTHTRHGSLRDFYYVEGYASDVHHERVDDTSAES